MAGSDRPDRTAEFRIDREGRWHFRGTPVQREAMVRHFAGMLRRDAQGYVLQTPEQLLRVAVDDAPFLITDMEVSEADGVPRLWMITNLGDRVLLGGQHPLELRQEPTRREVRAYVQLRDGIPALVHRNVFYRLAELASAPEAGGSSGVHSDGVFFPLE